MSEVMRRVSFVPIVEVAIPVARSQEHSSCVE